MYQFSESGIDRVYLLNGYDIHKTPYGKGVSIKDQDGLYRAIALALVHDLKRLNGREFAFLRKMMEMDHATLGKVMALDADKIRIWELSEKYLPGPADRLIRILYCHQSGGPIPELVQNMLNGSSQKKSRFNFSYIEEWSLN